MGGAATHALQAVQQLLFDGVLDARSHHGLLLTLGLAALHLLLDRHDLGPEVGPDRHARAIISAILTVRDQGRADTHLDLSSSLRMRIRYCVILVKRCLHLWMRNLGQNLSCVSIWRARRTHRMQSRMSTTAGKDKCAGWEGAVIGRAGIKASGRPPQEELECRAQARVKTRARDGMALRSVGLGSRRAGVPARRRRAHRVTRPLARPPGYSPARPPARSLSRPRAHPLARFLARPLTRSPARLGRTCSRAVM